MLRQQLEKERTWKTWVMGLLAVNTIMVAVMFGTLVYLWIKYEEAKEAFNRPAINRRK